MERIATLEAFQVTTDKNITAIWEKVNFHGEYIQQTEGALKISRWVLGFVGFSNLLLLAAAAFAMVRIIGNH